jgi:hypothetical protein
MPRELSPDVVGDMSAARLWASAIPFNRDAARPIATWCAEQMHVSSERLPALPAVRALCRDDGLWIAGRMAGVDGRDMVHRGLLLLRPDTPVAEIVGAIGLIPLVRPTHTAGRRDDGRNRATIVIGLPSALAIAGVSVTHSALAARVGQVFAAPDATALLAIELPTHFRCVAIINPAGDASFGDGPVIGRAAQRFRLQGRRVMVIERGVDA